MLNQKKEETIKELTEKIQKAKAVYLTDYRGLSVNKIQILRRKINDSQAELQVAKNTLLRLSLEKEGNKLEQNLDGPTAILFSYTDEVNPLKITIAFAAENNDLPKLKFGFLGKQFLDASKLQQLAKLPNKKVLYTQLLGTIQSPLKNLLYSLNYHTVSLLNALNQIKKQKEVI